MNPGEKSPVLRDIGTIKPYPLNAKKHPDEQVARLAESIRRFGWRGNPILVDKEGVIIAGHGRRLASLKLGLKHVPVIVEEDMTAEEARAFRLADNRAATSEMDSDILKEELLSLDFDLEGIFDKKELDFAIVDMFDTNSDAFVDSLEAVIAESQKNTIDKIAETDAKRVPLFKIFGFKDVGIENAIWFNRLAATAVSSTKLEGEAAVTEFLKQILSAESKT